MHPRQRRVDEGMGMASTVEHLLAMLGYIIVLIGIAGLPPSQVPPLGAGAQTLTEASAHSPAVTLERRSASVSSSISPATR